MTPEAATPEAATPAAVAAQVQATLAGAPAPLPAPGGRGRLLCLDGPAGSGKSTLARAVADLARSEGRSVSVLSMDDLYEGWRGLGDVATRLRDHVVGPLAETGAGRYRRWDWHADAWAEEHAVAPVDLLVLEGVGSGTPLLDPWRSLLVWVDAPHGERMRRGVERDGPAFADQWERWAADEDRLFARDGTCGRADLLVDGTGRRPPRARPA